MEEEIKNSEQFKEKNEVVQEVDLNKYNDVDGLTLNKLNFGLWYFGHKKRLKIIFISLLFFISIISWAYSVYGFAYYFFVGMDSDNKLAQDIVRSTIADHSFILKRAPVNMQIMPVEVLNFSEGKYDFMAQVKNPNLNHWAQFNYYFLVGERRVEGGKAFIMPGETKYLISLAKDIPVRPSGVALRIEDFSWKRIDSHLISDWNEFKNNHLNFSFSNIDFVSAQDSGLSDKVKLNYLKFNVANNTAFNYWTVDFNIFLYSGSRIVGVNRYSAPELMSNQKQDINISWMGAIPAVSRVEIYPDVNIFDEDVYIKYEGGIGKEK